MNNLFSKFVKHKKIQGKESKDLNQKDFSHWSWFQAGADAIRGDNPVRVEVIKELDRLSPHEIGLVYKYIRTKLIACIPNEETKVCPSCKGKKIINRNGFPANPICFHCRGTGQVIC